MDVIEVESSDETLKLVLQSSVGLSWILCSLFHGAILSLARLQAVVVAFSHLLMDYQLTALDQVAGYIVG